MMKFELLVVPDCPNENEAADLFRTSLATLGLGQEVTTVIVTDNDAAERLHFAGSPSFFVDGHDVFPNACGPGLACRLYRADGRLRGLPDQQSLLRAITQATATRR